MVCQDRFGSTHLAYLTQIKPLICEEWRYDSVVLLQLTFRRTYPPPIWQQCMRSYDILMIFYSTHSVEAHNLNYA